MLNNNNHSPRYLQHLHEISGRYPDMSRYVDEMLAGKGVDLPNWPSWCFMPMAAWYSIVSATHRLPMLPPELVPEVSVLSALGAWRYCQGVYSIDNELLEALLDSPVSGDLPSDVLYHLPEWCVYVPLEHHPLPWCGYQVMGFWAHLEFDVNTQRTELRFLFDTVDEQLIPAVLHLGDWSVADAVNAANAEAIKQAQNAGLKTVTLSTANADQMAADIQPFISILLYLCSEEPDIDDAREPGAFPANPRAKKIKKGWKLFPASKVRYWNVGAVIGERLRKELGEVTGRTVSPHIRRAHWHGYWTGPKAGERKFTFKWIPPILVGY